MARPETARRTRRAQVQVANAPSPDVGVYAPLETRAPPSKSASALAGLAEVLGTALNVGMAAKPKFDEEQKKQGMADQALDRVDPKKRKWIESYEKGVFEGSVIEQYNDAERAVVERAAQELDRTAPIDEQTAQIDAWMKEELGELALQDPRARKLIADRYNTFIQNTTNSILKTTTEEQTQRTLDNTLADITTSIKGGGDGRIAESIDRIASVSGDRNQALTQVVGAVMSVAQQSAVEDEPAVAKANIERYFALIPNEIELEDGTKLRPRASPSMGATITDSKQAALDLVEKRRVEQAQDQLLGFGKKHEDATFNGELLPWSFYEDLANRDVITDGQALAWYSENKNAHEQKLKQRGSENILDEWLLNPDRDWRWHTGFQLPDGKVATEAKFQERFDAIMQGVLAKGGPESFPIVVAQSRRTGIPYTPMKTALSQVSGDNIDTIAQYFPMYQQLRAAGMAEMYVEEKAMPYWLVAEAMHQTGVDPTTEKGRAQLQDRLRRLEPDRVRQYVTAGREQIMKKLDAQVVNDEGINTTLGNLSNASYARAEVMRLAELNLQLQVDPDNAMKAAIRQISSTHFPLELDGEEFLVPNEPGVNKQTLQDAMTFFEEEILPKFAAREGRTREDIRFEVARLGGRETEIRVVDFNGNNIAQGGKFWSPAEIISMYREFAGAKKADEVRAAQDRQIRTNEAMQQSMDNGEYWNTATDTRY